MESQANICNICGANYEYRGGRWKCPACGAYKPDELSPEERTLIDTAERYLRTQHYVEAEEAFEDIIRKYPKNHEGYWGYVRARYGIKYEEDYDGKRIPTCTAVSIESFTDDPDFLKAVQLADKDTAKWYRAQAEYIEHIRKMWIEKASKEKPYDIFICYKDSDRTVGIEQTQDSIEAAMLYAHLQAKGYRVFFSRESLRDKVGEKYEPYIFNALSTAKIMIVYSSSAEYIRATWLKNEWHRYIKKIEKGEKKENSLIVAYDGFSPSELPTVLASKQCIDASKHNRNFYHDLDACVDKIVNSYSNAAQPVSIPKPIPMVSALHEHKYKSEVIKGSCLSKGYTIYRCECGEEYRDNFTPLQEHTFKKTKTQEPTCTETGYEEYTCSVCGDKDKRPIAAKGHTYGNWVEKKRPTCTEKGEQVRQCSICGQVDSEPIVAIGHKWSKPVERKNKNGEPINICVCSQCGEEKVYQGYSYTEGDHRNFILIFSYILGVITILLLGIGIWGISSKDDSNNTSSISTQSDMVSTEGLKLKLLDDGSYTITGYNGTSTDLVIPEKYNDKSITSIETDAFKNRTELTSVTIPDSATQINTGAFSGCANIEKMTLPSVGWNFARIFGSTSYPGGVPSVEKTSMNPPLSYYVPQDLVTVVITSGSIGYGYFHDCDYLESVIIEDCSEYIGAYAFMGCSRLSSITIPNGVKEIDGGAFFGCSSLSDITMPDGLMDIEEYTFWGCSSLSSITIPEGVKEIGQAAFMNCSMLSDITMPQSIVKIDAYAFASCESLANISIPNKVATIGYNAFDGCSSITSITVPKSVTSIGSCTFIRCSNITIYCEAQSMPSGWDDSWNYDNCPVVWNCNKIS